MVSDSTLLAPCAPPGHFCSVFVPVTCLQFTSSLTVFVSLYLLQNSGIFIDVHLAFFAKAGGTLVVATSWTLYYIALLCCISLSLIFIQINIDESQSLHSLVRYAASVSCLEPLYHTPHSTSSPDS
ncbi:hypothetical protein K461DRAFT_280855 [Myriangium duriaei CBS 260.36]|uniref:Uncharacterized protein n=1 Tax=Myriangium duriaei CBS 260.36 TaxID=1168546 RepID=A0A9P4MIB1_9PEZI|nr:hypothetical protein K461DRAFT_280855 [Myriangium duriaei CBS 260.36]